MNSDVKQSETDLFMPMTTTPNFDAIPQVLKDLPRWLCWQLQRADPKPKKVPMTPKNGKLAPAAVNKPENWLTFDEAQSWFNRGLCSGIGFALTNDAPKVCCVDVDHCFNPDTTLTDEALSVIELCGNSWVEISQSGTGIHVWFIDEDFNGGRRKGNVEIYAADRYIALTGNHVDSTSTEIKNVNGACNAVIAKFAGSREENLFDNPAREDTAFETNERRLIEYFRSEKCKERDLNMFNLFNGLSAEYFKNTGKGVDDSVADCDLMLKILYYVGGSGTDADIGQRAEKIFGQSQLAKREKWRREDYRLRTLDAAFNFWVESGRNTIKAIPTDSKNDPQATLKAELRSVKKALADFDAEKSAALERLREVETFDSETVFSEEILKAAAGAKLFYRQTFSDFRREVKNYGDKHPLKKVSVNEWLAEVKERAVEIATRQADLIAKRNSLQAQINSLSLILEHDALKDFTIPQGYSISEISGIIKVEGEKSIPVCRRPVIITGKTFSVDEKIYKLSLSFMTTNGKWKELSPTEKAIVFNKNKLVDLANADLPVTTSNATHLVDFLDAFNAQNESSLPLIYNVSRCGWHEFGGQEHFIDPRRPCVFSSENGKNISVEVSSQSQFATCLTTRGSLSEWKRAYELAKPYPVARFMVASVVAPLLLKVLGERNFLVYIYAPTRAGKTTALYLGASAVGSEKIIRSFDATKNGLAGAAADVNDYPFLVDEKQVADNRISAQMSNLIYALANGIGRTKLNRDSTLKKLQDWRTIAIMTGETLLLPDNVTGGANTRLLTIKAPKEILPADVCKIIRDTTPLNYGLALPKVIDKVAEIGRVRLRGVACDVVDAFSANYPALLPEYCRYMAVLTLADTILNSALFGNTVTHWGKTFTALEDATLCAKEIFKLIPTTEEIDDTLREKEFVRSFIAQNQNRFDGGNVELNKMQAVYGKLRDRDGFTYITVQALKDACAGGGFDYRKLVSDLIAVGFFTPADNTGKGRKAPLDTVQKRLGEVNTRCYRIPNTVFDEAE